MDSCGDALHNGKVHRDDPPPKKAKGESDLVMFDSIFPQLVEDLTQVGLKEQGLADAMAWFKEVLNYNVPFGKKNRGLTVVQSYIQLCKESAPDEDDIHLARVLGWCVEINKIGLIAVNDALYLDTVIYFLLKKYIKDKPYYVNIVELFHQTVLQTVIGQNLDTCTPPRSTVDFTNYTQERYDAIVKWKTAYYSFYLPVAIAMYMVGMRDEQKHDCAKSILLKMGEFFQIQDDYLDCYGDPAVTGKVGTDIEDNKVSWLIVQALKRTSPEQKRTLQENYAQWDPVKVQKVKDVFNDLDLKQVYKDYEESSYNELMKLIENIDVDLPKEMFIAYGKKIYKRQK